MKRIISYLLAAVLVFAPCVNSYAAEIENPQTTQDADDTDVQDDAAADTQRTQASQAGTADADEPGTDGEENAPAGETDGESEENLRAAVKDSGQIDVYIRQALLLEKQVTFTVSLEGTGRPAKTITLPEKGSEEVQEGVTFENLEEGTYNLKVTAPGFADYSQPMSFT